MRPVILQFAVTSLFLIVPFAGGQSAVRADELFSESRLDTVFTAPTEPSATTQPGAPQQPGSTQPGTVLKKDDLEGFIRAAGFEAKKVADNVYAVEVVRDKFRFPVGFTISPNGESLWVVVVLNTLDENTVSPRVLLGLLAANSTYGPAHFVYDPQGKRIDLNRALVNVNLQPSDLKREVDITIEIAVRTADLWSNPSGNGTQNNQPAEPATPVQQPETPAEQPETRLQPTPPVPANQAREPEPAVSEQTEQATDSNGILGIWAAVPQKGKAFAVSFDADGTFVMTYQNPKGKQSTTTGRFTLTADTLTLAGDDGKTLSGKFTRVDATSFVFVPTTSGLAITFVKVEEPIADAKN